MDKGEIIDRVRKCCCLYLLLLVCIQLAGTCLFVDFTCNSQVYKARRVATMKMVDDGFEEKAKARKDQKLKTLADKGLLKRSKKRKKGRTDE